MRINISLCKDNTTTVKVEFSNVNFEESQLKIFKAYYQLIDNKHCVIVHLFIHEKFEIKRGKNNFVKKDYLILDENASNVYLYWWNNDKMEDFKISEIKEITGENYKMLEPRQGQLGGVLGAIPKC